MKIPRTLLFSAGVFLAPFGCETPVVEDPAAAERPRAPAPVTPGGVKLELANRAGSSGSGSGSLDTGGGPGSGGHPLADSSGSDSGSGLLDTGGGPGSGGHPLADVGDPGSGSGLLDTGGGPGSGGHPLADVGDSGSDSSSAIGGGPGSGGAAETFLPGIPGQRHGSGSGSSTTGGTL